MSKNLNNNFFDDVLSIIGDGTKIFNESFIEKMQDKIKNAYYKAEEWRNGELVNSEEKEWEDGKLIKDMGESKMPENKKCECDKTCHCGKNVNIAAIEEEYLAKLQKVDKEVDKLREIISSLTKENTTLKEENSELRVIISEYENKFNKLNDFFKNF